MIPLFLAYKDLDAANHHNAALQAASWKQQVTVSFKQIKKITGFSFNLGSVDTFREAWCTFREAWCC